MSYHTDEDYSSDDGSDFEEEEEPIRRSRGGTSGKKRGRSNSESAARRGKKNKSSASIFIDSQAQVDDDDEEYDDEEEENDFFVNGETDLPSENVDQRKFYQQRFHPGVNVEEDIEKLNERYFQERYAGEYEQEHDDDEEELTEVDQQSLLPSVYDPKLWMVKCAIGREREVAVCLMQKVIDRGSDFKIRSVIALDHLQNYIYIEADMEAHVKEAIKGMRNIYVNQKILLVPVKEMTDVVSAESKAIDLSRDTWVRMKLGIYKGDLAQVVDVDNVRRKVTVKLIPRIDLHVLANKLEGIREIVKKKAFVPPPRFMNIDEARELHICVERRRDRMTGEYFENIGGMQFKDGFLYKKVSTKSITTQNIRPTLDELERFKNEDVSDDPLTLFANRKKGHFMKGDAVIVIKGDLKNLKGWIEKVDEENVFIRPDMKGLPNPLAVNESELCKYFEPGNLVKIVSGKHERATGMVLKVEEQHFLIILSDTSKEHIRVFADHVVKSKEKATGVTKIGDYERQKKLVAPSPSRFQRPQMGYNYGGGKKGKDGELLVGSYVKVRLGPFKGYSGRLVEVKEKSVRLELEAKIVTVDRKAISEMSDNVSTQPSHQFNMGSQTPLRPCMTPMRVSGATPIHDGMRTPMRNRAWNPYTPMTPARNNWEDGNPGSWMTNLQPGTPHSRGYEAPTHGSGLG